MADAAELDQATAMLRGSERELAVLERRLLECQRVCTLERPLSKESLDMHDWVASALSMARARRVEWSRKVVEARAAYLDASRAEFG